MNHIPYWSTSFGQKEADQILKAIENKNISHGPITREFEKQLASMVNVPFALATTSGSMALVMALLTVGVRPGDEVIIPNRTFIATAHAALMLGAKVLLVDTMVDSQLIDISLIEEKITSKTKVIIPVHLNGCMVDMKKLGELAKKYGLFLIEDATQALFCKDKSGYAGTLSDIGVFSFGITKLTTTGQGGVAVTNDRKLFEKMRLVHNHGVPLGKTRESAYNILGCNFKFTDIQASAGIAQLNNAEERIKHVNVVYEKYKMGIKSLPFLDLLQVDIHNGKVALYVEVLVDNREDLIEYLASNNIQTDRFLPSLHLSNHLDNQGEFPNSNRFNDHGLSLPCGPNQPLENVDIVIDRLEHYM